MFDNIDKSKFETFIYTRSQIDKISRLISRKQFDFTNTENIKIIDNWRAAHTYPLEVITEIVNEAIDGRKSVVVVSRLKRVESIIGKLQRTNNTGLYRMQDLGGCRVIVPDIADIIPVVDDIKKELIKYNLIIENEDDYIMTPRSNSGYRSYHIIVRFVSDDSFNGMRIEIQVRSKLQHRWATAVELLDSVDQDNMKAGLGKEENTRFFKIVSALFSIKESTPLVDGVPETEEELVSEIYQIENQAHIREKLSAINCAIKETNKSQADSDYFLLIIDYPQKRITTIGYSNDNIESAINKYHYLEKKYDKENKDCVLITAKNFDIIRESYPNYFLETLDFLMIIREICLKYPEKSILQISFNKNCDEITNLFESVSFETHEQNKLVLQEDGIGICGVNTYYCPEWNMGLEKSYLRLSCIGLNSSLIPNFDDIPDDMYIQGNGPAIAIMSTGACFYVNDKKWRILTKGNVRIVQCKQNVNKDTLLLFLAWIKSNIFAWDLIWNKHQNSIYCKSVFDSICCPKINENTIAIVSIVSKIMEKEHLFISQYNSISNAGSNSKEEKNNIELSMRQNKMIEDFNADIKNDMARIEKIFCDYFEIDDEKVSIIKREIGVKGVFVY